VRWGGGGGALTGLMSPKIWTDSCECGNEGVGSKTWGIYCLPKDCLASL
jgi:hypothetical protein